jgi:hypothetical protein
MFHIVEKNFETKYSYWCKVCKKYIMRKDLEIKHYCSDEYLVFYEFYRNSFYDSYKDVIIVDEYGSYDDVIAKKNKTNK